MWWKDPQHTWQLAFLGTGSVLMLLRMAVPQLRKGLGERGALALMLMMALGSSMAYTRFLDFHGPRQGKLQVYHDHDIYHYLIGAKYYPELGHERLYECTWLAFAEMRSSGIKTPRVSQLRSLSNPNRFFDPNTERSEIEERCQAAFAEDRWTEFKSDLRAWLAVPWNDQAWRVALVDLGYNPPPTYNLVAHNIAEWRKPLRNAELQLFPFVDMTLVFVVGGACVYWAFGPWGLAAYLVVFGTNWIASYRWTGGSFCRQLWFVALVAAVSALKKERWALAGAALAVTASFRVFPLVFVLGAVLALAGAAWRDPARRRDLAWLVGGGLGTAVLLVAASIAQFGVELWSEFFHKMSHHGSSWFMWHIGFKKFAVFDPAAAEGGVRLAKGFWWVKPVIQDQIWQGTRLWSEPLRVGMSLAALAIAWNRKATEATLVAGGTLLFCWAMPANYYYVYMALAPAVFFDPEGDRYAMGRVFLSFAAMISLSCSGWVHPEPYVMNGWLNWTMFLFFLLLLLSYGLELGLARRRS